MPDDLLEKRSGHTQSVSRALSLLSKLAEEPELTSNALCAEKYCAKSNSNLLAKRPAVSQPSKAASTPIKISSSSNTFPVTGI